MYLFNHAFIYEFERDWLMKAAWLKSVHTVNSLET